MSQQEINRYSNSLQRSLVIVYNKSMAKTERRFGEESDEIYEVSHDGVQGFLEEIGLVN